MMLVQERVKLSCLIQIICIFVNILLAVTFEGIGLNISETIYSTYDLRSMTSGNCSV